MLLGFLYALADYFTHASLISPDESLGYYPNSASFSCGGLNVMRSVLGEDHICGDFLQQVSMLSVVNFLVLCLYHALYFESVIVS